MTDDLKILRVLESEKERSQIPKLVVQLAVEPIGLKMSKIEETYKKLLEKHANVWDTPQLRLWAKMICSG